MLTSAPPGNATQAVNRQLPQSLAIPGQQQQTAGGTLAPFNYNPDGFKPSSLGAQPTSPAMLNGIPPIDGVPQNNMLGMQPPGMAPYQPSPMGGMPQPGMAQPGMSAPPMGAGQSQMYANALMQPQAQAQPQ